MTTVHNMSETETETSTISGFEPIEHLVPRAPRLPEEFRFLPGADMAERAMRAAGAFARHEARVEAVMMTALHAGMYIAGEGQMGEDAHLTDPDTWGELDGAMFALLLLEQDIWGVGGPGGIAGHSTERPACFSKLGKGRKQASDGGAWDAAIEEARNRIEKEAADRGCLQIWEAMDICGFRSDKLREVLGVEYSRALAARVVLTLAGGVPGIESPDIMYSDKAENWASILGILQNGRKS